jgi:hypothetical protein
MTRKASPAAAPNSPHDGFHPCDPMAAVAVPPELRGEGEAALVFLDIKSAWVRSRHARIRISGGQSRVNTLMLLERSYFTPAGRGSVSALLKQMRRTFFAR